jgi:PEP-CTERM motif
MLNQMNSEPSPVPESGTPKKSSTAVKLIQAAALAAVLVPLGSIAVETSTCTFYGSGGATSNCATGPEGGLLFDFGTPLGTAPYKAELLFDEILPNAFGGPGQFDVTVSDSEATFAEITARFADFFAGYQPVPIGPNPAAPYIVFQVDAPAPCTGTQEECANATNTWRSAGTRGPDTDAGYELWIYWIAETDALFPNPEPLHDTGDPDDGQFDIKITIPGSYNPGPICGVFPGECVDPAVGGRDDMFKDFTLADATALSAVPEPASLVLLGTGISGLLYRRRQRRLKS